MNKLFAGLGSVRIAKNCDLGHSFSLYGPPSRQITYIYADRLLVLFLHANFYVYVEWKNIRLICDSRWKPKLFVSFVFATVLSIHVQLLQ